MDFLFLSTFTITGVIFLYISKLSLGVKNLNAYNVTIVFLFLFGYLPHLNLYFQIDPYRVSIGVVDKEIIILSWAVTTYVIFVFIFIFSILRYHERLNAYKVSSSPNYQCLNLYPISLFLIFISYFYIYDYISKVDRVALFVAFADGFYEAKVARSEMVNSFSGSIKLNFLFAKGILPYISILLFLDFIRKRNKVCLILFLLAFIGSCFSFLMTTEKAPVIWYLASLALSLIIFNKNQIRISIILKPVFILFFFIVVFDSLFMGNSGFEAVLSVLSRVTSGGITPVYFYLEHIPRDLPYLLGGSFPNPAGIFPYEPFNLTVEIARLALPHLSNESFVSTMPAIFWGELYANFGFVGLIFVPAFAIYIGLIFFVSGKISVPIVRYATISWLIFHFRYINSTGISEFFIDLELYSIFILALLLTRRLRI